MAIEFAVCILWKLCKNVKREEDDDDSVLVEGLQAGAFQKLLVLLQVGSDEIVKEKATELSKLLNPYREKLGCVDHQCISSVNSNRQFDSIKIFLFLVRRNGLSLNTFSS